jgi:iron complex transport system substrate-binding protein
MLDRLIIFILFLAGLSPAGAETPKRWVSLAPATTEILFALGAGSEVVGVTSYCNYPEEAGSKEIIGSFSQPNMEKIVSLKPDIVFCTGLEQQTAIDSLRRLKLEVCVSDPKNLAELYASIIDIGKRVGREEQARELTEAMREEVERVRQAAAKFTRKPKVFAEIWNDPLMTAGVGSFVDELITIAGGTNIAHDTVRPYCRFSEEQVLERDPDIIVLLYPHREEAMQIMRERTGWSRITAVKNKHVYADINQDILIRPGPRLVKGLRLLQQKIAGVQ